MKRVILCALSIVLVFGLCIPVSATELNHYFFDFRESGMSDTYFVTTGKFSCLVNSYDGEEIIYSDEIVVESFVTSDMDGTYCTILLDEEASLGLICLDYGLNGHGTFLSYGNELIQEPMGLTFELTRLEDDRTLMETISDTLGYLIQWSGLVLRSVVDGPLSGYGMLFAIGIAVTVVLFGIRFLCGFQWGI